jgi:hypothetical protein
MATTCPKCNSERVRRSKRRGVIERISALFGLKTRRCHECNVRFLTLGNSMLFRSDLDVLVRKSSVVVLAAFAVLAVVWVVLWLSRSQSSPSTAMSEPAWSRPSGTSDLQCHLFLTQLTKFPVV